MTDHQPAASDDDDVDTVDTIVARILAHSSADPDAIAWTAWNGKPRHNRADHDHADVVRFAGAAEDDHDAAALLRESVITSLRATAGFPWGQARDALDVLTASGIEP